MGCLEDLVTADMCFFKAFWGRRKGSLPTFGMEKAFRRSIFVWSSDHAVGFVALLQFRGMTTTQMHFECCSTHSRGVVRCFFVFKKKGALRTDDLRISSRTVPLAGSHRSWWLGQDHPESTEYKMWRHVLLLHQEDSV